MSSLKQAFLFISTLGWLALTSLQTQGQVLVYRMETEKIKGINFHVFERGFMVVPLLGGEGSFVLTTIDGGRSYLQSPGGGRLFTAVDGDSRRAVISAVTGDGTAQGTIVAMGDINETVKISSPAYHLTARVAKSLKGNAVSADDESQVEANLVDERSIGSAGIAEVKFSLSERETDTANRNGLTLEQTVEQLVLELERQGYVDIGSDGEEEDQNGNDDDEAEQETSQEMNLNMRGAEVTTEDLLSP